MMLGKIKIFNPVDSGHQRSPKRRKIDKKGAASSQSEKRLVQSKTDPEASGDELDYGDSREVTDARPTDLESALAPFPIDQNAIEEYEAFKSSQGAPQDDAEVTKGSTEQWERGRSSIYVDAFNLALDTVLDTESHLFDEPENGIFEAWRSLDYEAQYLYVRLFLRKTDTWHRINNLGYHSDISNLHTAIKTLQQPRDLPNSTSEKEAYPGELSANDDITLSESFVFADASEDHIKTLEEASSLLLLGELKAICKDAKISGNNKSDLLDGLRRSTKRQSGLNWGGLRRSNTEDSNVSVDSEQTETGSASPIPAESTNGNSRRAHLLQKIMNVTGPCIRLSSATFRLFERVHLVFYRSSEWTEKSLTTIILAKIARRNFPPYIVSRSASIFESRSLLLEFEASIRTQFRVDTILEFNGTPSQKDLQSILDIFEEVHPRWQKLLKEEQAKENSTYQSGEGAYLRRLSPAWVYTRILHKVAYVMGKLKHHKREYELLTELLTQRLFHPSRRGAWYQRKALLEEHYMGLLTLNDGRSDDMQKKHWKRIALGTCEDALQDSLVHLIYHYDLQKRVMKLEKSLKIAKRLQHDFAHVRLAAAKEVTIEGIRIERPQPEIQSRRNSQNEQYKSKRGTRTIWLDPLDNDSECTVEEMCLSHYRSQGWKGYHSEGGIVRTLFAYLFYDIIFTYVPNVFQTPYQTCPLDLHTDSFYPCRLSEINMRLAQIGNGEGESFLRQIWTDHAEQRTSIVGLNWDYDLDDLIEIMSCFDANALAIVCKVMAQEYGQRGGGVPDLFLWHMDLKIVMFAEVKSENDRLSDTQRLWIDVLTSAGVRVELCNAHAKEVRVCD